MFLIQAILLLLAAAAGTVVVATRDPRRQVLVFSFFGFLLSLLFLSLQAPDVAFSEIVVGSAAVPFMILAALRRMEGKDR